MDEQKYAQAIDASRAAADAALRLMFHKQHLSNTITLLLEAVRLAREAEAALK